MKAKEFRVGNWVKDIKNGYGFIDGIKTNWVEVWVNYCYGSGIYKKRITEIEPIPLTPEVLDKIKYLPYPIKIIGTHRVGIEFLGWRLPAGYEYLHQLQNVVYALTNEELEMNF